MPTFTDPLEVEFIDGTTWKVTREICYTTSDGEKICVPAGFLTDFASVPRAFWVTMSPAEGPWGKPSVIHDWLYFNKGKILHADGVNGCPATYRVFSREECDRVFLEAMQACGVGSYRSHIMWLGVRLGGWLPWGKPALPGSNSYTGVPSGS